MTAPRGKKKLHQMMVIKTTLKNLLCATVKPTYRVSIQDTILGLTCFCILAILHCHFWLYGWIYPQEIANNELRIMQPWDPQHAIYHVGQAVP